MKETPLMKIAKTALLLISIQLSALTHGQLPDSVGQYGEVAYLKGQPFSGERITISGDDTTVTVSNYANGLRIGRNNYFGSGALKSTLTYDTLNYRSVYTEYHRNGHPKSSSTDINGVQQGDYQAWHENGTVRKKGLLIDGSGIIEEFYPTGQLRSRLQQKNGFTEGISEYYCENGQLISKILIQSGLTNYQAMHCNGNLKLDARFIDSPMFLVGRYQEFHENGKRKGLRFYEETIDSKNTNKRIGKWKYYDEQGKLVKTETYKDGKLLEVKNY
jgi:antitoxin component YwqK of YwqJK toxin-antitoxin module